MIPLVKCLNNMSKCQDMMSILSNIIMATYSQFFQYLILIFLPNVFLFLMYTYFEAGLMICDLGVMHFRRLASEDLQIWDWHLHWILQPHEFCSTLQMPSALPQTKFSWRNIWCFQHDAESDDWENLIVTMQDPLFFFFLFSLSKWIITISHY